MSRRNFRVTRKCHPRNRERRQTRRRATQCSLSHRSRIEIVKPLRRNPKVFRRVSGSARCRSDNHWRSVGDRSPTVFVFSASGALPHLPSKPVQYGVPELGTDRPKGATVGDSGREGRRGSPGWKEKERRRDAAAASTQRRRSGDAAPLSLQSTTPSARRSAEQHPITHISLSPINHHPTPNLRYPCFRSAPGSPCRTKCRPSARRASC